MNRTKKIFRIESYALLAVIVSLTMAAGVAGGIENGASLWNLLWLLPCFCIARFAIELLNRLEQIKTAHGSGKERTEQKKAS